MAQQAAKKAAKKVPQDRKPPKAPVQDDLDFEPIRIDSSKVPEIEMVHLFSIDDTDYYMPKRVRPAIAMKFLQEAAEIGVEVAMARAIRTVLGPDTMTALATCDAVTEKQLTQIMDIIENKIYGTIDRSGPGK